MSEDRCLTEEELYGFADGESRSEQADAHLAICDICRQQYERFQAELNSIRQLVIGNQSEPSATDVETALRNYPSFLSKYFIAGKIFEDEQIVSYRGAHSLLNVAVRIFQCRKDVIKSDNEREMFLAACQEMASIRHAAISRMLDADIDKGRPFVVIEHHEGVSLEEYFLIRSPSSEQQLRIAVALAGALTCLHQHQLTHGAICSSSAIIDHNELPLFVDLGHGQLRRLDADGSGIDSFHSGCVQDVRDMCDLVEHCSGEDLTARLKNMIRAVREPTFDVQQQPAQYIVDSLQPPKTKLTLLIVVGGACLLIATVTAVIWWLRSS